MTHGRQKNSPPRTKLRLFIELKIKYNFFHNLFNFSNSERNKVHNLC